MNYRCRGVHVPMFLWPFPFNQKINIHMYVYMYINYTPNLSNECTYIPSYYFSSSISFIEGLCSCFPGNRSSGRSVVCLGSQQVNLSFPKCKVSALLHLASLILHILKSGVCFVHTKEFVFNTEIIGIDKIIMF